MGEVSFDSEDDFGQDLNGNDFGHRIHDHSLLERLFVSDRLSNIRYGPDLNPLLKPLDRLPDVLQNKEGKVVLALPPPQTGDFGILTLPMGESGQIYTSVAPEILAGSHLWYFFCNCCAPIFYSCFPLSP